MLILKYNAKLLIILFLFHTGLTLQKHLSYSKDLSISVPVMEQEINSLQQRNILITQELASQSERNMLIAAEMKSLQEEMNVMRQLVTQLMEGRN